MEKCAQKEFDRADIVRDALKKSLTELTLLEMSGKATYQDLAVPASARRVLIACPDFEAVERKRRKAQSAPRASLEDDSVLRIHVLNGFLDSDHAFVPKTDRKKNKLLSVF